MKIAFFSSDNYASSGAFRAEVNLIKDLQAKGHEIILVLPCYGTGKKFAKQFNIKCKHILSAQWVYSLNNSFGSKIFKKISKIVNKFAALRIKKFLKSQKIDLAVMNTLWNGVGASMALELNIPYVWHLREALESGQNHTLIDPSYSYELINKSKACIAVSQYVKDYYKENIDGSIVKVVYDGVDKNIFYNPQKQLFRDKKTHFLMLGTVNPNKGQHIGIQALNSLSNYDFDVTIVGGCGEKYKKTLLSYANNIKDRIQFVKPTPNPESFYKKSDVFLMNSIGEAFGLVTVEAMMSGLVVIGAKCSGSQEIILNEDNGYFYNPQDVNDLAKTIKRVLDDKDNAIAKSKNGQNRAIKYFDKFINSNLIEKTYIQCLNK